MIKLLQEGKYRLIETKGPVKILSLENKTYAWIWAQDVGQMLVTSHKQHTADLVLAAGHFRLYDIEDEPHLADLQHLELNVGDRLWQGYLLLTGLPTDKHRRARIIPTKETISVPTSPNL